MPSFGKGRHRKRNVIRHSSLSHTPKRPRREEQSYNFEEGLPCFWCNLRGKQETRRRRRWFIAETWDILLRQDVDPGVVYFAEGSLLAFVIAPKATAKRGLLMNIQRRLSCYGDKVRFCCQGSLSRSCSHSRNRWIHVRGLNIAMEHLIFLCHITVWYIVPYTVLLHPYDYTN